MKSNPVEELSALAMLKALSKVEHIAGLTKIGRFLHYPFRYGFTMLYKEALYPITRKEKIVQTSLFYGRKMKVALPAASDIYLTGGKSHISEIRLAKFIIRNMKENTDFLYIGAHYGYFTLIASELAGTGGRIVAFEPAPGSFRLLSDNTQNIQNISIFPKAVTEQEGNITFYEFPNLHSEYSTREIAQFEQQDWFRKSKPVAVTVAATSIDAIIAEHSIQPAVIKIDVEGGEYGVIAGGMPYFRQHSPQIAMEYIAPGRDNANHKKAIALLEGIGYVSHLIDNNGNLQPAGNLDRYLEDEQLESDNIVLIKMG